MTCWPITSTEDSLQICDIKFHNINISTMFLFLLISLLLRNQVTCAHHSENYHMEGNCGATYYMNENNINAVRLRASPWPSYRPDMDCLLTFETVSPERLHVVFSRLEIEFEPKCDNDFLTIYDGNSTSANGIPGLPKNICGKREPKGAFASSGQVISVLFKSDSYQNDDGFDLVITSFHEGPCREDEFQCADKRCIDKELECDGLDNCGDKSDECDIPTEALLGIIFGFVFLSGFAIVVMSCLRTRRESRKEKKKLKQKLSSKGSIAASANSGFMFERSDSLFPEDDWQNRHATVSLKKPKADDLNF